MSYKYDYTINYEKTGDIPLWGTLRDHIYVIPWMVVSHSPNFRTAPCLYLHANMYKKKMYLRPVTQSSYELRNVVVRTILEEIYDFD